MGCIKDLKVDFPTPRKNTKPTKKVESMMVWQCLEEENHIKRTVIIVISDIKLF